MGRDKRNENKHDHYTQMFRKSMETPAWRKLSRTAQAWYPWIKLEWKGAKYNNNGKIRLSIRQAAERMGVKNNNTAARAFHELQAKGFIVVTEPASLGVKGKAQSPCFEMTELPLPHAEKPRGRRLFEQWTDGNNFPVHKAATHNPNGRNGK